MSSAAYCFQKVPWKQILLGGWRLMCFFSRTILFSEKKISNDLLMVRFQEEVKGCLEWSGHLLALPATAAAAAASSRLVPNALAGRVDQMPSDIFLVVFLALHSFCFAHCYLKIKPITPPSPTRLTHPCPFLSRTAFYAAFWTRLWTPEIDSSVHLLLFSVCFYFTNIPHVRGI